MRITMEPEPGERVEVKRQTLLQLCEEGLDAIIASQQPPLRKGAQATIALHPVEALNTMRMRLLDGYQQQMQAMNRHLTLAVQAIQRGDDVDLPAIYKAE